MKAKKTQAPATGDENAKPSFAEYEAAVTPVLDYVEHVVVPRILAAERRRAGDPHASPKDYDCCCPLSVADRLPICCKKRPDCRFSHRAPPPGPHYGKDPVRHALFQREARALLARFPEMDDAEFERITTRIAALQRQRQKQTLKKMEANANEADKYVS